MFNDSSPNLNSINVEKPLENDWSFDNDTGIGIMDIDTLSDIFGSLKSPFLDVDRNQTFGISNANSISSMDWNSPSTSSSSSDAKSVSYKILYYNALSFSHTTVLFPLL